MILQLVLIGIVILVALAPIAFAVWTVRRSPREEMLTVGEEADDHFPPGLREVADMGFGTKFVDAARYSTCVVVVGADPDRPGYARVRSFGKTGGIQHDVLDPADVADCLRDHADDIEAVL